MGVVRARTLLIFVLIAASIAGLPRLQAQTRQAAPFQLIDSIPFPVSFRKQDLHPDRLLVSPDGAFILLDRNANRLIRLEKSGKVTLSGGFGQSEESLFEPVDVKNDAMNVIVLDRGRNGWVQFDARLHFLAFIPLDRDLDPEQFSIDPFGNYLVAGYTDPGIFRKTRLGWDPDPFIDFQYLSPSPGHISFLRTNPKGQVALIGTDPDLLAAFTVSGRLQYQLPLKDVSSICGLFYLNGNWTLARQTSVGLQLENPVDPIMELPVNHAVDVVLSNKRLIVLTDRDVRIYGSQH